VNENHRLPCALPVEHRSGTNLLREVCEGLALAVAAQLPVEIAMAAMIFKSMSVTFIALSLSAPLTLAICLYAVVDSYYLPSE